MDEIALIDGYIANQQALSNKLLASASSAAVVVGQWLVSDRFDDEDSSSNGSQTSASYPKTLLAAGVVVAVAFFATAFGFSWEELNHNLPPIRLRLSSG